MANKTDFKTVETSYEELEELEEKIRKHRKQTIQRTAAVVLVLAVIVAGIQLWSVLRSYSSFEIRSSTECRDNASTKYETFMGNILEYNNDGMVCRDSDDELVWNQSFEMSSPALAECENYLAVYDRGGTSIYIMTVNGLVRKIETAMPVSRVCIASQGSVAVLMKEDHISYVKIYDRKGKELANGEFFEETHSFPVDIAFSSDAQKLAVDMLDVTDGKVCSTISFYNFGSVGQNEIDNNVGTYSYDDMFISEIAYVGPDQMLAIGNSEFIIFEGGQKPAPKKEIKFKKEIQSVFYNHKYAGIVYSNPDKESSWHIKVYDMNGKTVMENDTEIAYSRVEFLDNNEICVRDSFHCELYTIHSIRKFSCTFDKELYKILSGTDSQGYTFVMSGEKNEVRLQ